MKIKNWEAILGDCLEEMKNIPDGSIEAIITDVPYGTTACKWDTIIPFDPMWTELERIIKPNGAIVLFWSEPFSSALRMSNIKNYKYDWIWDKKLTWNPFLAKIQPLKIHELISIFWKWKINYYPQWLADCNKKNYQSESDIHWWTYWTYTQTKSWYPKTIITNTVSSRVDKLHPTQKPVALMEYLIKTYTKENETVLDFTAWSFTTAVACENTNRKWICIEKDENYFNTWINRIWKL